MGKGKKNLKKLKGRDRDDLRAYLVEIIVAGRWLKERLLSFTIYASILEASLLTHEIRSVFLGILPSSWFLNEVQFAAILIFVLFLIIIWFNWKSTEQTRKREKALHRKLSPHLLKVIKSSTGKGNYSHFDWNDFVTILSYFAHILPVLVLMFLNLIDFRLSI